MADTEVQAPAVDLTPVTAADAAPEQAQTEDKAPEVEKGAEGGAEKKDNGETPAKGRGDRNGRNGTEATVFNDYKLTEQGDSRPYNKNAREKKNYRDNIKTNYEQLPETSDPDEIRKQVEFYFSESNLTYDNYMQGLVGGSENNAVPIKTITNFKRMRRFQPYSAVVAALKESTLLNLVNEDELQRKVAWKKPEVDTEFQDPTIPRSIYAKGFGKEGSTTQFDIENFFAIYGPISAVRLRRNDYREFKGSAFVEFETEELQKQFLELEGKPKWEGNELQYKSKDEYVKGKEADIASGKIQPSKKHQYK
jgi:lupus La protein